MLKRKNTILYGLILSFVLITSCDKAAIVKTQATDITADSYKSAVIKKIEITDPVIVASKSADREPECAVFTITENEIRHFLATAQEVSEQDDAHTIDWSACQAESQIEFTDGQKATLRLEPYGSGLLSYTNGDLRYLYCEDCFQLDKS